jgi:hypothetical protein
MFLPRKGCDRRPAKATLQRRALSSTVLTFGGGHRGCGPER